MSPGLPCRTLVYRRCLITVECLCTQPMSHRPGPRLLVHACSLGSLAQRVAEGRAPSGVTGKGHPRWHRGKCVFGVGGHRGKGRHRRGGRAPPGGSVPHPSPAPAKAALFRGSKLRNSVIKATQKKEVRGGRQERFEVPHPPQVGSTFAHAQLQTPELIFHHRPVGLGSSIWVTPLANTFRSFLASEAV